MTKLNSQFDVIGHDPHPNAGAGLLTVLEVDGAKGPYSSLNPGSGTPVAGDIFAGAIVVMKDNGKAILANQSLTTYPAMPFVTVDGDQDYDGAFVHVITCIQGGAEYQLDGTANFVSGSYTKGSWLTWGTGADAGKFRAAAQNEQVYAMVGPGGYNANKNTLHVIVPQGIGPKKP